MKRKIWKRDWCAMPQEVTLTREQEENKAVFSAACTKHLPTKQAEECKSLCSFPEIIAVRKRNGSNKSDHRASQKQTFEKRGRKLRRYKLGMKKRERKRKSKKEREAMKG